MIHTKLLCVAIISVLIPLKMHAQNHSNSKDSVHESQFIRDTSITDTPRFTLPRPKQVNPIHPVRTRSPLHILNKKDSVKLQ